MTISLRLTKTEEKALERAAKLAGVTKSEYLRQCFHKALQAEQTHATVYDLGKDLFGGDPSGRTDLVANAKQIVREKIHAKSRRH